MTTIEKTAAVTTERGTVINLTVTATRGYDEAVEKVWADQYVNVKAKKVANDTSITATVNGKSYKGWLSTLVPASLREQGVHALLCNTFGISKQVHDAIKEIVDAAISEAESDAGWIEYKAEEEQAMNDEMEYYRHKKAVENMMTLNGRTY